MSTINAEDLDKYGRFAIVTREVNEDELVIGVHRTLVGPGSWGPKGVFVPTNLSNYPKRIQVFANGVWTPEVIKEWMDAFPYEPPEEPKNQLSET